LGKRPPPSKRAKSAKRPSTHFPTRRRRGSYLTVTGYYPSSKAKGLNFFEGLRERDFFVLLDYDPDVETFEPHPFRIDHQVNGRARVYTPGVLVNYRLGADGKPVRRHELCEVKVRRQVRKDWAKLRARFRAAQRYGRGQHWRFRIVHEHAIPRPFISGHPADYFGLARDSDTYEPPGFQAHPAVDGRRLRGAHRFGLSLAAGTQEYGCLARRPRRSIGAGRSASEIVMAREKGRPASWRASA